MREDILALCRAMGAGEEQDVLLLPLIEGASAELEHLLRRGVKPEDCGRSFALAAAMLAMDGLEAAQGGGQISGFTAGELSMRLRGESGGRSGLRQQALRLMAPWLGQTGFVFRGVPG